MQCKDIPDRPILEFLSKQAVWGNWFEIDKFDNPNSVRHAMPKHVPGKLVLAKMRQMMRRGFVSGCDCGCRGDFEITNKGMKALNQTPAAQESGQPVDQR